MVDEITWMLPTSGTENIEEYLDKYLIMQN